VIAQLRTHTINRGMMASWVKLFNEVIPPLQERHGITVDAAWTNEGETEFIRVRCYADAAEQQAKEAAFYGSPEWQAIREQALSHLAEHEWKVITPVLAARA
jgi:NIPSNAP